MLNRTAATARSSRTVVLSSPSGIIPTARKVQAAEIAISTQSLGLRVDRPAVSAHRRRRTRSSSRPER
ncbi:hypothetical protein ACFQVA_26230 [Actinomadura keratinilytica]